MIIENDRLEIIHANKELYPHITQIEPQVQDTLNLIETAFIKNKAEYYLIKFFQKLHQSMEKIHEKSEDEPYTEFIEALTTYIKKDWKIWKNNLNVNTLNDLDNFIHIIKLSNILIKEATATQDTELLFEAYYQTKSRLSHEKLVWGFSD